MSAAELPSIAIIADAHFHDIDSDYGFSSTPIGSRRLTLRSWADTRCSSRVFNESKAALEMTLTDIGQRGVKHVVLLGDYTDDGQIEATTRLVELLHRYQLQFGIAFYAIPGNHDVHGPVGKNQSTRFATTPGETVLVTSCPKIAATQCRTCVLTHKMYCEGTPAGLLPMAEFGLFRQDRYQHWETPFGQSDSVGSRRYDACSEDGQVVHELFDASYLVEPVEGLWLLMIDANVFEPRNGQWKITQKKAFLNSSDAGWNSVLRNKRFLIDWISDVCSRASALGKSLFTFSHYPISDPFNDPINDHNSEESALFGRTTAAKRTPDAEVAKILSTAGVQLHFGGHLHVNGLRQQRFSGRTITDVAVPSVVAFPACYKIVHPARGSCNIETVSIGHMSLDPVLIEYYCAENQALDTKKPSALSASNYGEFLYQRMRSRVVHHYLPTQWPVNLSCKITNTNVADLVCFLLIQKTTTHQKDFGSMSESAQRETQTALTALLESQTTQHIVSADELARCSMTTLIADWYCLRQGEQQAIAFIDSDNLRLYSFLAATFGINTHTESGTDFTFFSIFLRVLNSSLERSLLSQEKNESGAQTVSL